MKQELTLIRGGLAAAAAAMVLGGCASGRHTTAIDANENFTFIPTGRIAVDIAGAEGPRSQPRNSHAVELGVTGSRGNDKQKLDSGDDPVIFGGETFLAPQDLRYEFDFRYTELAYRYRHFFGESGSFGVEGLAGLGYASIGLRVFGATQTAAEHLGNGGLVLGVGGIWRFRPSTSLQARLSLFSPGKTEGITSGSRIDVQVAQQLGRHAAVRGGWSSWGFSSGREDSDEDVRKSPIHINFSGPTLGLELMF